MEGEKTNHWEVAESMGYYEIVVSQNNKVG